MNALDVGLVVIAAALTVVGLVKGFIRLLVGAIAVVAAFLVASRFHSVVAERLGFVGMGIEGRRVLAYVVLFLAVVVTGGAIGWLLSKLAKIALLGWADRLAGAALGFAAAVLAGAVLILPVAAYAPQGSRLLETSRLAPYLSAVADVANLVSPRDLAERYRRGIDSLRKLWRGEGSPAGTVHAAPGGRDAARPRTGER